MYIQRQHQVLSGVASGGVEGVYPGPAWCACTATVLSHLRLNVHYLVVLGQLRVRRGDSGRDKCLFWHLEMMTSCAVHKINSSPALNSIKIGLNVKIAFCSYALDVPKMSTFQ